jgi:hypothetical protein
MFWGVKEEEIELGAEPIAKHKTDISFKHTSHMFNSVEEFEVDEFLSSQINCV